MAKIKLQLVTQEKTVFSEEVDSLTCPTQMGEITVLPGHIPLIAALQPGEFVASINGSKQYIAVEGGFVEVRPGNEVVILADMAEHAADIDVAAAEEAKSKAEQSMKEAKDLSGEEYARLAASLQRSLIRIKVGKRHTHRSHHTGNLSQSE